MKFMHMLSAIALLVAGFATAAQAQVEPRQVDSWEDLKNICQNPGTVNLQRPPGEITSTCVLNRRYWQPSPNIDEVAFPGEDNINYEGSSDKTTALRLSKVVDLPQEVLECPRAEQVEEIYTLSFSTTCEEVVNFDGDFGDFCYMKMQADTDALEDFKVSETIIPESEVSLCGIESPEDAEEEAPENGDEDEDNGDDDNGDEDEDTESLG